MKILLVVHQFFPESRAGTEVLTLEMAREFISRGHEVIVVAGRRVAVLEDHCLLEDSYEQIPVHRIQIPPISFLNRLRGHVTNKRSEQAFSRVLEIFRPDIVHFNHVMGVSSALIHVAKNMGYPVVFTPTDFWAVCPTVRLYRDWEDKVCTGPDDRSLCFRCFFQKVFPGANYINKWIIQKYLHIGESSFGKFVPFTIARDLNIRNEWMARAINATDQVLAPTKFLADLLIKYGISQNKILLVPFGVNVGVLQSDKKNLGHCAPLRIGFIGSIVPSKGVQVLVDAYRRLGSHKANAELKIYGNLDAGGDFAKKLVESTQELGSGVEFCGTFPHDEIGRVLESLDVLIVPSIWYENTPLVLYSALASRTPVVVSKVGGMVEIVEEGVDGFFFEANDSQALADILREFILNRDLALNLAAKMQNKPVKNSAEYASDVERIYFDILAKQADCKESIRLGHSLLR